MSLPTKLKKGKMSFNILCGVLGDVLDINQNTNQFFIYGEVIL